MQALAGVADHVGEPALDVEVHVFEVDRPGEIAAADFLADGRQSAFDGVKVGRGDDVGRAQHAGMGDRSLDVELGEPLVESDRSGETFDEFIDRFAEASRPCFGGGWFGAVVSCFVFCRHELAWALLE